MPQTLKFIDNRRDRNRTTVKNAGKSRFFGKVDAKCAAIRSATSRTSPTLADANKRAAPTDDGDHTRFFIRPLRSWPRTSLLVVNFQPLAKVVIEDAKTVHYRHSLNVKIPNKAKPENHDKKGNTDTSMQSDSCKKSKNTREHK